jgi:hypothetical protein
MDRLDAQPARRVEYPREQPPGLLAGAGTDIFTQRLQVGGKVGVGHPHPRRKPGADAVGHFGRTGLGKGQAQDGFRRDSAEQQAQHPCGQHMGLACAG